MGGKGQLGLELLPPALDTAEFRQAWEQWLADRAERRLPRYTARAMTLQLRRLEAMGAEAAIAAINWSIAQGYRGIFPEPAAPGTQAKAKQPGAWELKERIRVIEDELDGLQYPVVGAHAEEANRRRAERRRELAQERRNLRRLWSATAPRQQEAQP